MAHWFHRNLLKASAPVSFEAVRSTASNASASKLLPQLREARAQLLRLCSDSENEVVKVQQASEVYLSLLLGMVNEPNGSGDSKLRKLIMFKWTNSICDHIPTCEADTVFELVSVLTETAVWYTKHASKLSAKSEITMDEAKDVHNCLRAAAGFFKFVKEGLIPRLGNISADKAADTDSRILEAYQMQCVAEAQEVTVARAVELKHKASLISALTYETSKHFTAAGDSLKSVDPSKAGKWKKYCELKAAFYQAYAYCFCGEALLEQDECGKAIRALQESDTMYKKAESLCREYTELKGPGVSARPWEHPFFNRIGPLMRTRLEKAQRENGFIYFHKIPAEPPDLEMKATYGLASPQDYTLPSMHPVWTAETYAAFDVSKATPPEKSMSGADDVKPVNEPQDKGPVKPAQNASGCTVS